VAEVLALVDRRAESPMESRVRMALYLGGLPPPAVQHPVVARGTRYHLDLAYPDAFLRSSTTVPITGGRRGPAAITRAELAARSRR
jgi:hypothetical protein